MPSRSAAVLLVAVLSWMGVSPHSLGAQRPAVDLRGILAAEAARARTPEQLEVLLSTARNGPPVLQVVAVRALGRLERPDLVREIVLFLNLANSDARAEAANAAAQAAGRDPGAVSAALTALRARLGRERDNDVRAAILEALGRLPAPDAAEAADIEQVLLLETARVALRKGVKVGTASPLVGFRIGWGASKEVSTAAAVGALRGLESMFRASAKSRPPLTETVGQLRELTHVAVTPARRLALLALNVAARADQATLDGALVDDDVEVRRLAAGSPAASAMQLRRALGDRSPAVRYEALRAWGRRLQAQEGCGPILSAARDENPHVVLLALDLLGNPCKAGEPAAEVLAAGAAEAGSLRRSHAIAALARVAPDAARPLVPALASSDFWVTRTYAARAAAALRDLETLRRLSEDRDANVRDAAVSALARLQQHQADDIYVRALQGSDGQLLMTAARALEGTPNRAQAVPALLSALDRLTKSDSDSTRDPRLALLDRLHELGSREWARSIEPLLRDFDPRVADRAAAVLAAWTGEARAAAPQLRSPQAAPSDAEVSRLSRSLLRVTMKSGGQFDIRLLTDVAPLSCAAFARLAASGYYNGLTVHRIVPNFIVQGGSPGANEYAGADRFMVDEFARTTQSRGTVGTSTRGRDTGDGQFYVNLADNPRLDHEYTIFGEVARGMEAVDAILEGDTIARIDVISR